MGIKKNIKLNAVLNVIKTISSIIFPLITFPYISRVLMPENIGKINFSSSFVSYFALIASLGITTYAIRECSAVRNNKKNLEDKASQIFSINSCTTIVAYIAMIITILCFRSFDSYRTLIIIQSLTIAFTTLGADWLNSAMEDFAYITIRTICFQFISLMLTFMLVKKSEDYLIYAGISVLSSSGVNIVNFFYRKKYCKVRFVKDMQWKEHFKPIVLLFVMILMQTIFNSADITMLGLMKGDFEVGLYSTAIKMSNLIAQVVTSLAWVVMPRMSQYFAEENYTKINIMLRKVLCVLLTLGMPCAIGAIFLSKEIVLIIAGRAYEDAATALCILMISFLFSLIGGSFLGNMILLPSKREKTYMIICCIATTLNLVLNYILIPIWGVNAAAGTTAIASFTIMVLLIVTVDKRIKISNIKSMILPPVIGSFFIGLICWFTHRFINELWLTTIICIGVSGLIYFVIQLIMKNEIVVEFLVFIKKKILR